ncbi:hypothetical protein SDC9_102684 [bioreactor metagenome]|uniref:Uncharacterized protein n=1 Tax=bioreactor metagenome TaxID=1076179 RepID=A0A645ASK5_9ZZZZ
MAPFHKALGFFLPLRDGEKRYVERGHEVFFHDGPLPASPSASKLSSIVRLEKDFVPNAQSAKHEPHIYHERESVGKGKFIGKA